MSVARTKFYFGCLLTVAGLVFEFIPQLTDMAPFFIGVGLGLAIVTAGKE